jgi:hypothetical protein
MGVAIDYTLSNWEALLRYTEDGDPEIDNNIAVRLTTGEQAGTYYEIRTLGTVLACRDLKVGGASTGG